MTERPSDTLSVSSDDTIRIPPRLDNARLKPGPGALAADAFDPLKQEAWEEFWYHINQYYQPINQDDVRFLRAIPVNPYGGAYDSHLRVRLASGRSHRDARKALSRLEGVEKSGNSQLREWNGGSSRSRADKSLPSMRSSSTAGSSSPARTGGEDVDSVTIMSSLNSFPFTHRLVAAMLDVGGVGGTPTPSSLPAKMTRGSGGMDPCFWVGVGEEGEVREFQVALEERVKIELVEHGLMDERDDDELQSAMRHEQWKLRDTKYMTRMRKTALYTQIIGVELRAQAIRREVKKYQDQVEMAYLERMVRNMKKNKKSRSKFQKLLQRMFGHYKEKDKMADRMKKAAETISNGRLLTNGDERGRSSAKKKKRKGDIGPSGSSSVHSNIPRKGMN